MIHKEHVRYLLRQPGGKLAESQMESLWTWPFSLVYVCTCFGNSFWNRLKHLSLVFSWHLWVKRQGSVHWATYKGKNNLSSNKSAWNILISSLNVLKGCVNNERTFKAEFEVPVTCTFKIDLGILTLKILFNTCITYHLSYQTLDASPKICAMQKSSSIQGGKSILLQQFSRSWYI